MSRIRQNSFLENMFAHFGDINAPFWREIFCRMSRIRQNSFLENMFAHFEDINAPFWREIFYRMSRIRQNSFQKNMFAHFGDINAPFDAQMCVFFARRFWHFNIFVAFGTIYHVGESVLKKFRKLPSARRIFPKVFRRSHFWTSILVHFLRIFLTLVQIESKNNKINLCNNPKKTRA